MSEWKLVPVEPDAAMVRAGQHALMDRDYSGAVFKAMLAASPPAPSTEPVAWIARYTDRAGNPRVFTHSERKVAEFGDGVAAEPLYASPPDHTALLRQALDALRVVHTTVNNYGNGTERGELLNAIDALRAALGEKR
jgi:hypothetical protein